MAKAPSPASTSSGLTEASHGSFITLLHTERAVTCYPITEGELTTLQMYTSDVTWYASAASGIAGFGINVAWEYLTNNDANNNLRLGMVLLCLIAAGLGYAKAIVSGKGRQSELNRIMKDNAASSARSITSAKVISASTFRSSNSGTTRARWRTRIGRC